MARKTPAAAAKFIKDAKADGFTVTVAWSSDTDLEVNASKTTENGTHLSGTITWMEQDVWSGALSSERLGFRTHAPERQAMKVWMATAQGYGGRYVSGSIRKVRATIGLVV